MAGAKLSRISENAVKLTRVFHDHGNPFNATETNDLVNLLTQSVMRDAVTNDILQRDAIGQHMFEEFVQQRLIEGKLSVWARMTRRKINTFKSESASVEIKIGDKLVKMKEERSLLQRFIVISRSRKDLDLKDCIGEYEFGVIPRSLFSADGCLLLPYDKASILHQLEKMIESSSDDMAKTEEFQVPLTTCSASDSVIEMQVDRDEADIPKVQCETSGFKIAGPDLNATSNTEEIQVATTTSSASFDKDKANIPEVQFETSGFQIPDTDADGTSNTENIQVAPTSCSASKSEIDMHVHRDEAGISGVQFETPGFKFADPHIDEVFGRILIVDGMAVVNSITKTDSMKTCADFADAFLSILCKMVEDFDEIRLVFDRYIEASLKNQTRKKRANRKTTYYHVKDNTLIKNIPIKDFLSDSRTKKELTDYLAQKVISHSKSKANLLRRCLVTSGTKTEGNFAVPKSLLTHSQEEADTIMILHAATVSAHAKLVVYSPDTDVLLLLVHFFPKLPDSTAFLTGKGRQRRVISVSDIYNKLGQNRSGAILGLHAFTGCDVTGRFGGRTKDWCFKAFLSADANVLTALAELGRPELEPETWAQLERFVFQLYRSKTCKAVKSLRWYLFSNRAAEGENLPPTFGSLYFHILRANYVALLWKNADVSHPNLPSPTDFGWEVDNASGSFIPKRCLHQPAPESVLKLIRCWCKTGCGKACGCFKNNNPCTEICSCMLQNCENAPAESIADRELETE